MLAATLLTLLPAAVTALGAETQWGPRDTGMAIRAPALKVPAKEHWQQQANSQGRHLCYVEPDPNGGDDGPAIQDALANKCRSKALVVFPGPTYNIQTTLDTQGLKDVLIEQYGRFLWGPDVDYWLTVTMPVGFQNQSTVWYFGGDNVVWDGHNEGTFDGNGQIWYDWAKSQGNLPHRPISINWRSLTNSKILRLRFVQSQMWTMAISNSKGVLFEDIYVNSTSTSQYSTLNTDGADTIHSDSITFRRWTVSNGDDSIALKGNSTNISVYDSVFYNGQGYAIGSMGQFKGEHEQIENFYASNTTMYNTNYAIYMKTWPGIQDGYPPNGGGGGLGYARNIVVDGVVLNAGRGNPLYMEQCENYEGDAGKDCDSSQFKMEDIIWKNIGGTTVSKVTQGGHLQCSLAAGGCNNITIENFSVVAEGSNTPLNDSWFCVNVHDTHGFKCSPTTTTSTTASATAAPTS